VETVLPHAQIHRSDRETFTYPLNVLQRQTFHDHIWAIAMRAAKIAFVGQADADGECHGCDSSRVHGGIVDQVWLMPTVPGASATACPALLGAVTPTLAIAFHDVKFPSLVFPLHAIMG
jgi:hypothetical protein